MRTSPKENENGESSDGFTLVELFEIFGSTWNKFEPNLVSKFVPSKENEKPDGFDDSEELELFDANVIDVEFEFILLLLGVVIEDENEKDDVEDDWGEFEEF